MSRIHYYITTILRNDVKYNVAEKPSAPNEF